MVGRNYRFGNTLSSPEKSRNCVCASEICGWGTGMTSLPGQSQLQHQERQERQPRQQFTFPQPNSTDHQFYPSGPSPDFDGASPTRNHASSTPQKREGGGSSGRKSETQEWGLTKAGKKRQRLPLACQVCRKKKVILHMNYFLLGYD